MALLKKPFARTDREVIIAKGTANRRAHAGPTGCNVSANCNAPTGCHVRTTCPNGPTQSIGTRTTRGSPTGFGTCNARTTGFDNGPTQSQSPTGCNAPTCPTQSQGPTGNRCHAGPCNPKGPTGNTLAAHTFHRNWFSTGQP